MLEISRASRRIVSGVNEGLLPMREFRSNRFLLGSALSLDPMASNRMFAPLGSAPSGGSCRAARVRRSLARGSFLRSAGFRSFRVERARGCVSIEFDLGARELLSCERFAFAPAHRLSHHLEGVCHAALGFRRCVLLSLPLVGG